MSPAELAVLDEVDNLRAELVSFTQALVRVPTVNPPGARYPDCAELIARKLDELGYTVEVLSGGGVPNVIGTLLCNSALSAQRSALHFNGHYDVVPPGQGWSVDPFGAVLNDDRIYGRGACDQKSGIAASIFAVEAIRRAGIALAGTIEQSATPDEESGGFAGVGWLCDIGRLAQARQDYVVITEPLDPDRVCVGHRGVYWFQLTTVGRVGHGSMPGLAVNAAERMARAIVRIEDALRPVLNQRESAVLVEPATARKPSISLSSIHAGQLPGERQTPTVPDHCIAVLDRRFIHEESFETVRQEIVALLDHQIELRDLMRVDPLLVPTDGVLPRACARAIQDVLGVEPPFIVSPGTFDMKHVVRRAGIAECIGYGPGRLILAHQPDEFVAVDDLVTSTKVLALLAMRLIGPADVP